MFILIYPKALLVWSKTSIIDRYPCVFKEALIYIYVTK